MEKPVVKKRSGISPIWILPILALVIGGWLLFKSFQEAGIDIVVHFANAEGITVGKTKVIYKGIPIGIVRDVTIDPGIDSVSLHIEMDKRTKQGMVEDTTFWIVRPRVEAGRISGLDTLLSGSYIAVRRGVSKVACREFKGLPEAPPIAPNVPGLHIVLRAPELGSIQRDTQLYYKNIPVGSVQSYTLAEDGSGVLIKAFIQPKFTHLVHTKTRFWNSSGVHFKGGLSGFKFRIESLAALLYGGISLYTPSYQMRSPAAANGHEYHLYEDFDDAEFGIPMSLKLPSADGIEPGTTKVMYRGFKAGVVNSLSFNADSRTVTAKISIDPRAEFILREGTRFWVVKPELSLRRIRHLETLVKGCYIAFEPGDGIYKDFFVAVDPPQTDEIMPKGSYFTLLTDSAESLSIGAPILFRRLKVGEITGFDLGPDRKKLVASILIYKRYCDLVHTNSVFWKSGGLDIAAGLDGIKVEAGSIEALVAGGITFTNPPDDRAPARPAKEKQRFTAFDSYQEAVAQTPALQEQGLTVQLKTRSTRGVTTNSPVLYKDVKVGRVKAFRLDPEGDNVLVDVFISQPYTHLLQTTSLFYDISGVTIQGGLSGIKLETGSIKSIISGGVAFFTPRPGKPAVNGTEYILYDNLEEAQDINKKIVTIRFNNPNGLNDNLDVRYQGITIGHVRKVEFPASMAESEGVLCQALIDRREIRLFTTGTRVWLIKPEVSLAGVNNLDTLIGGSYINVEPGPGEPVDQITALNGPPTIARTFSGLNLILEADRLGSLKQGSPIYYRQVKIGRVTGSQLSDDARKVFIHVNIVPPYNQLVYSGTHFWNTSGVRVRAGLFSGVKVNTESVEALVAGGISMATPDGEKMGDKAVAGQHFTLYPEGKECWEKWSPAISLK